MVPVGANGVFARACNEFVELGTLKQAQESPAKASEVTSCSNSSVVYPSVVSLLRKCVRETANGDGWSEMTALATRGARVLA